MASKAKRVIGELFDLFMEEPSVLPDEWRFLGKRNVKSNQARLIADYIAGMTDRYALLEYDRLFEAAIVAKKIKLLGVGKRNHYLSILKDYCVEKYGDIDGWSNKLASFYNEF